MAGKATGDRLRGKTLRWTFTEGPQAGKTYEHAFRLPGRRSDIGSTSPIPRGPR